MEVKPGYKLTEVGVIPEDWEVAHFSGLFEITAGGDFDPSQSSDLQDDNHPYPIYSNAVSDAGLYGYCSYNGHHSGSISVTARGTLGIANYRDHDFNAIGRVLVLKPIDELDGRFFSEYINNRIIFVVESTGVPQLTAPQIAKINVVVPPLPEQTAIATTLSDVDALISSLDALISKKKQIKQGAMQELLSGKRRLPGFSGEWEVKRLGDVALIKTGARNNQDKIEDGIYPFFVRSENIERINSYCYDEEAILVPGEGRIGDIFHYIHGRFDVHQRVYVINQFSKDVFAKFIYFYLVKYFGKHAMQNTVKATVDSLRLPTFQKFEITIPPRLPEQKAIAAILSDMDAEITTLESRRNKTKLLKQGMMQELLTGRIRLVPSTLHAVSA